MVLEEIKINLPFIEERLKFINKEKFILKYAKGFMEEKLEENKQKEEKAEKSP